MVRWVVLVSLTAVALTAVVAGAQSPPPGSIAMRWDDCYGDGGAAARSFACNTNSGFEALVVTAYPPVDLPQLTGVSIVIDVLTTGGTLPDWWQFQTGGCRTSALVGSFMPPPSASSCVDPWQGAAQGGVNYFLESSTFAKLRVVAAIPGTAPAAAGTELFLARVVISHAKTTGTGVCAACASGLCLGLNSVELEQPAGVGNYTMFSPLPATHSDVVGWQGAFDMPSNIFLYHGVLWMKDFLGCQSATQSLRPTWGAIKQLYR